MSAIVRRSRTAELGVVPRGVRARSWYRLFVGARAGAALVAAGLLALRPVENADPALGVTALLWSGLTIAAVSAWPWLMARTYAWVVDLAIALLLVVASGDWRSPFYLLAVSGLIAPATTLTGVAPIAVGAGFTMVYFALALTLGIEWNALASTARLESFSTHLLIPILVVVALAQATTLIGRLDSERERAEALALEAERRRIAWELHDSAKQRIHAAHLVLSALAPAIEPGARERLRLAMSELDGSATELEASLTELRTTLGGLPLEDALRRRAGELCAASDVEISVHGRAPSLPTFAAVHAYRAASEAITNALRHAEPGRIDVTLNVRADTLVIAVGDDGRGFSAPAGTSTGLESMRARAAMLGSRLLIEGERRGGTRVELQIPLRGQAAVSP